MKWAPSLRGGSHFIRDRKLEAFLGFAFFVIGSFLLWDAYDNRGKKMKWPLGGIMPF